PSRTLMVILTMRNNWLHKIIKSHCHVLLHSPPKFVASTQFYSLSHPPLYESSYDTTLKVTNFMKNRKKLKILSCLFIY
ncbi:hypothetical protein VIGAN_01402000, partial [Vigna angularis var. angularis]